MSVGTRHTCEEEEEESIPIVNSVRAFNCTFVDKQASSTAHSSRTLHPLLFRDWEVKEVVFF